MIFLKPLDTVELYRNTTLPVGKTLNFGIDLGQPTLKKLFVKFSLLTLEHADLLSHLFFEAFNVKGLLLAVHICMLHSDLFLL